MPFTITQAGRYYFATNLTLNGTADEAIDVRTSNVTIDMNGFTLSGPGSSGNDATAIQVLSGRKYLTVTNGTIQNFGNHGIVSSNTSGEGNRIEGIRVSNVGETGFWLAGDGNLISDSVVEDSGSSVAAVRFGTGVIRSTTIIDPANGGISATRAIIVDTTVLGAPGVPINNANGVTLSLIHI